jgi:purine-binding chemotaxis protein CheW
MTARTDTAGQADIVPALTFMLGEQYYAFRIEDVVEVASMVELVTIPGTRPEVLGLANRHGSALLILDLRRIMGADSPPVDVSALFVVVQQGEHLAGLVVDEVHQVEYIPAQRINHINTAGPYIRGIISYEERLIQIITLGPLLAEYRTDAYAQDDWLEVDA